jgi:hypothetical protein
VLYNELNVGKYLSQVESAIDEKSNEEKKKLEKDLTR